MHCGFDRLGTGRLVFALLLPPALGLLIHNASSLCCRQLDEMGANRRCLLANAPELEHACREAREALTLLHPNPAGTSGGMDDVRRWLRDVGTCNGIPLQAVVVGKDPACDPAFPSLRASFRADQHIQPLLTYLQDLQTDARLVACDAVRLRRSEGPPRGSYVAEVVLHAHNLPPGSSGKARAEGVP
jgi:hypothetical protein